MGYVEELRAIVGHRPLILVGSIVIAIDSEKRILLQQRLHPYGYWAIPGGLMELGESVEETAKRELYEETCLRAENLHLIDVYSGEAHYIVVPNGDAFYAVTTAFYSQDIAGELVVDRTESLDFQFFSVNDLPEKIVKRHEPIIQAFLEHHFPKL